jgi:hypothetical protein
VDGRGLLSVPSSFSSRDRSPACRLISEMSSDLLSTVLYSEWGSSDVATSKSKGHPCFLFFVRMFVNHFDVDIGEFQMELKGRNCGIDVGTNDRFGRSSSFRIHHWCCSG